MTLIDHFMTGEYDVTRSSKGTYVRGQYQPGPVETIRVSGSLQPLSPREIKFPEEGNRLKQYFRFYTDAPIVVTDTKTLADSDRIQINGESYRVVSTEIWQNTDLDYFKSIVGREPEQ